MEYLVPFGDFVEYLVAIPLSLGYSRNRSGPAVHVP